MKKIKTLNKARWHIYPFLCLLVVSIILVGFKVHWYVCLPILALSFIGIWIGLERTDYGEAIIDKKRIKS